MGNRAGRRQQRRCDIGAVENLVDAIEDFGKRAETGAQRFPMPLPICGFRQPLQLAPLFNEQARLGALERIYRLLGVTHGKDGLGALGRAIAAEIIVDQGPDHRPLLGIGVLAFIDQNVIDPRIELVAHPGAEPLVAQQRRGTRHKIIEIHERAGALLLLVARDDGRQNPRQRGAVVGNRYGFAVIVKHLEPRRLPGHAVGEPGILPLDAGFGHIGACLAFFREIGGKKQVQIGIAGVDLGELVLEPGFFPVGRTDAEDLRPIGRRHQAFGENLRPQARRAGVRVKTQPLPHRRDRPFGSDQDGAELAGIGEALADGRLDLHVAQRIEQRTHGVPHGASCLEPIGQYRLARLTQKARSGVVFDHREIDRHPGLAREALQHGLAKGVDGVDLEPARRIERVGEKAARPQPFGCRRPAPEQPIELGVQFPIVLPGPARQDRGHPMPHLGRRRLGVGEAQYGFWLRAIEQQAQHPAREDIGLARAGIGRNPGIGARLGHPRLLERGVVRD